jgi:hypothetical protein
MKMVTCLLTALVLATPSAHAADVKGANALALATIVANHSEAMERRDKRVLRRLFNGGANVRAKDKITVEADSIKCRVSNVDITSRSCNLTFGKDQVDLNGRRANEVFATLVVAGVTPDGAAGSINAAVSKFKCTIDPQEIKQKAGGGADCSFDAGP